MVWQLVGVCGSVQMRNVCPAVSLFAANCALTPAMGRKLLAFWGRIVRAFF